VNTYVPRDPDPASPGPGDTGRAMERDHHLGQDWQNDGSALDEAFQAFATEAWPIWSDPNLSVEEIAEKIRALVGEYLEDAQNGEERESFREAAGRLQGFGAGWCDGGRRRSPSKSMSEARNRLVRRSTAPPPRGTEADVCEGGAAHRRYPTRPAALTRDTARNFAYSLLREDHA